MLIVKQKKSNKPYTFTNEKSGYSNIKQYLKHCLPFVTLKAMIESARSTPTSNPNGGSLIELGVPSLNQREEKLFNLKRVIVLANMPTL